MVYRRPLLTNIFVCRCVMCAIGITHDLGASLFRPSAGSLHIRAYLTRSVVCFVCKGKEDLEQLMLWVCGWPWLYGNNEQSFY